MQQATPERWEWSALIAVAAGLYALLSQEGLGWWLFAGPAAVLVLTSGIAMLLMPGDSRATRFMACGGLLGVLCGLPMWLSGGFGAALTAVLLFAASFVTAGRLALRDAAPVDGMPEPERDWRLDAKVALDEALMAYYVITSAVPSGDDARRVCDDTLRLAEVMRQQGWIEAPSAYHEAPPVPVEIHVERARLYGHDYERVSFDSGYQPRVELPGAANWLAHKNNGRAVAWVMRHAGPPRPWLLCLHGYRMGQAYLDFPMFHPDDLHRSMRLNLLMPVMPLHGPRKIGLRSGDHFLDGNLAELLFAMTQSLWDLRRWLAWLREQEDKPSIGVYGASMGAYNAAVLAQHDRELDFVAGAVPTVDFAALLWRYLPPMHARYYEACGLTQALFREILRGTSPLALPPQLGADRLHVLGACGDRVVPPEDAMRLAAHWRTTAQWYQGSHLSLRREHGARHWLEEAMRSAHWATSPYSERLA